MRRSSPGILGLALLAFVMFGAQPTEASSFKFNGASDDGMIVWDGAFDVATFNSQCSTLGSCNTNVFSLLNLSPTITLDISDPSVNLTVHGLHLIAAIPIASFTLTDVTNACTAFAAVATCFATLDDMLTTFLGPSADQSDLQVLYDPGTISASQAYLAVRVVPFSGVFPDGSTFGLDAAGTAFFNAIAASIASANLGFNLGFDPLQVFNPGTERLEFVPFTLDVTPGTIDPSSVPEPSTWLLFVTGGAALAWQRRRRQRRP